MSKKKKPKKARKKRGLSKGFRKIKTRPGSGTLHFKGTTKLMIDPFNIPRSTLYYHIHKNRKKAGQINPVNNKPFLPEAQGVILILKLRRSDGGPTKTISIVSDVTMVVNVANTRKFISDNLNDLEGNLEERFSGKYEDAFDLSRINDYSLKFIY